MIQLRDSVISRQMTGFVAILVANKACQLSGYRAVVFVTVNVMNA